MTTYRRSAAGCVGLSAVRGALRSALAALRSRLRDAAEGPFRYKSEQPPVSTERIRGSAAGRRRLRRHRDSAVGRQPAARISRRRWPHIRLRPRTAADTALFFTNDSGLACDRTCRHVRRASCARSRTGDERARRSGALRSSESGCSDQRLDDPAAFAAAVRSQHVGLQQGGRRRCSCPSATSARR